MSEAVAPGFFGKIPARGDFLSRRVPPAVASAWEAWLQGMTADVRSAAPPGWQDAWLTAPLWHFTLGEKLSPPCGAAGVLVASADRVGRLFPFTVIGAASPAGASDLRGWALAAEALIIDALDDAYDPASLDAGLAALGPPPALRGTDQPLGRWSVELDGDWPSAGDRLGDDGWDRLGPGQSAWWCRGSDRIAPVRLRCTGLPAAPVAASMILGGDAVTPAA